MREDEARSSAGVSELSFLECYDTVGWVTRKEQIEHERQTRVQLENDG